MIRKAEKGLLVAVALALAPAIIAHATEPEAPPAKATPIFDENIKRDAKSIGAAFKEAGHRVGVAAKAVGHEIATAAKRSVAETRTAMKGEKVDTNAKSPGH